MIRNVGRADRVVRAIIAIPLIICALFAPVPLPTRVGAFGGAAAYLFLTAIVRRCLGYRLLGRSTFATEGAPRS
jgi:hypothetical protein